MTTELSVTVTTQTTFQKLRQELEKVNDKNRELDSNIHGSNVSTFALNKITSHYVKTTKN